jgi:hypothetical protein
MDVGWINSGTLVIPKETLQLQLWVAFGQGPVIEIKPRSVSSPWLK